MILLRLIKESFVFAYNALRANLLRTFLSLLGITIGIFAIISVFTVIDSLEKNIKSSIEKLGDNAIFIQKWPWEFGKDYPWWKYFKRPLPSLKEYEILKHRSKLAKAVSFIATSNKNIKYRNNNAENVQLVAVTFEYFLTRNFSIKEGRYFTQNESFSGKAVAILGYNIAKNLFENEKAIGKYITIKGRKVLVIGVFAKEGESIIGNSLDNSILLPLNFARNIIDIKKNRANPYILVKAKDGFSKEELKYELEGIMRAMRRLKPKEENNFSLNEASLLANNFKELFKIINIAGTIIGLFSIVVGGFNIANIMFVSVKERTHIIGIQKAIGAKNFFILLQFLFESIFLSLFGGILGLFMVFIISFSVSMIFDIKIMLTFTNIIIGISISALIGMLAGIIPAYFAAKLSPVEAIRTVF